MNIEEFCYISDASSILGVCKATLRLWEKMGKIKAYRHPINRYRMYKRAELNQLVNSITKGAKDVERNI